MHYIQGIVEFSGEELICVVNMNTGSTEFFTYSKLVEFFRDKSVSNMRGVRKSGNELWLSFSEGHKHVFDFKFQKMLKALRSDFDVERRKASEELRVYLSAMSIGATIDVSLRVHWSVGHVLGRNLCYEERYLYFMKVADNTFRCDTGCFDYDGLIDFLSQRCFASVVVKDGVSSRIVIFDNVR